MKVYLCGPINGCTDEEASNWREAAKLRLPNTLDPMKRDYRGKEAQDYREIVQLDKLDIQKSDVLLVNYDKPSVGTSMEIFYAWQNDKPVIVVCRKDAVISPWLRYHATKIVHSFDEAYKWIEWI